MPSRLRQAGLDVNITLDTPGSRDGQRRSVADLLAGHARHGNRYTVEGEIARGGMGAVVRAIDCDIRREVAIKYMLDESDDGKKSRFVEEAQITGQLEHPNIVPIHELGVDAERRLFFAMKMVRGRSLAQILKDLQEHPGPAEKTWSLGRLLNIFVNVCHALAYAHSRGVIHRDLKPANIMVGDFGEVYVMDWGVAKVLGAPEADPPSAAATSHAAAPATTTDDSHGGTYAGSTRIITIREADSDLTGDGAIIGTPSYMSPEQAGGNSRSLDGRSDIYSLGAILYELLTLHSPIKKDGGHYAVLMRVATGNIELPEKRAPQRARQGKIPKELAAVAMKALALKPEDRYPTVESLRRDIERFQEGRSVSAKHDSTVEALVKFVKRNKAFSAATAVASIVLAVVVTVSMVVNYRARLQAETAQHKAEETYAQYVEEQQARREQAKTSVPAFVAAARLSVDRKEYDAALAQVNVALDFDPNYAQGRLLKAQLLTGLGKFAEARAELTKYLQLEPGDKDAARLMELCAGERVNDQVGLGEIADVLFRQGVSPLAEGLVQNRRQLAELYGKRIAAAWPGTKLVVGADGSLSLSPLPRGTTDLTPLRGIPLNSLTAAFLPIVDLSPLVGMPLTELNISNCKQVRDLTPLAGMKLTTLTISFCPLVTSLEPLRGMPLAQLKVHGCRQIKDLTPLAGMKLTELDMGGCELISDLELLRGMPLTALDLATARVTDLTPLAGMPLKTLDLGHCEQLQDLSPLAGMPLTKLRLNDCKKVRDFTPLKNLPLEELDIGGNDEFKDLAILQGMKLTQLGLLSCHQVRDLRPLVGMPLAVLDLRHAPINDLTPLAGMPLKSLSLADCQFLEDLSPLANLPLRSLNIASCKRVKNLAPLAGLRLESLDFRPQLITEGINAIRGMETLKTITPAASTFFAPAEFWKRYDGGEFRK